MIDLHIHTKFSDGTDDIDTIVKKVISRGVKTFAISDHDMTDGVKYLLNNPLLMESLEKYGVRFVTGIEFSGVINDNKVHILAYNFDIKSIEIENVVDIGRQKRYNKYLQRVEALKVQKGIYFSNESLEKMNDFDYIGNPIMSHYLVKDGIFDSRDEAMKCINSLDIPKYEINVDAKIIMPAINSANGIAVLAHPLGGLNEPRNSFEKVEEIINDLLPLGLKGLECYYNLYTEEECKKLVEIANKYGLVISAGSDYHGKNKDADIGEVIDGQFRDVSENCSILSLI